MESDLVYQQRNQRDAGPVPVDLWKLRRWTIALLDLSHQNTLPLILKKLRDVSRMGDDMRNILQQELTNFHIDGAYPKLLIRNRSPSLNHSDSISPRTVDDQSVKPTLMSRLPLSMVKTFQEYIVMETQKVEFL